MSVEDRYAILSNGERMPLLGLGCWQSLEGEVEKAIETALDCGYRHIDTAYNYLNEEAVGNGLHNWLNKSKAKRSDVFVVTKLPMIGMYQGGVEKFLKKSLAMLKLDYVDLYLIHLPVGLKGAHDKDVFPTSSPGHFIVDNATDLIAVWKEMESMVDAGLVKSIGISNFNIRQIRKICAIARIQPTVHQVEMHVFYQQKPLKEFCDSQKIILTAYAPLGSPTRSLLTNVKPPQLLTNPVVQLVADRHNVSTAQVLIKFWVQQGVVTIPKSVNPDRIKSNGDIWGFTLSEVEMSALVLLDRGSEGRSFVLMDNPSILVHPECPV